MAKGLPPIISSTDYPHQYAVRRPARNTRRLATPAGSRTPHPAPRTPQVNKAIHQAEFSLLSDAPAGFDLNDGDGMEYSYAFHAGVDPVTGEVVNFVTPEFLEFSRTYLLEKPVRHQPLLFPSPPTSPPLSACAHVLAGGRPRLAPLLAGVHRDGAQSPADVCAQGERRRVR